MDQEKLINIANKLVISKKGVLAADESSNTIKKRFDSIKVDSTETNRRDYREMLFNTEGISESISGVILYDETIRQNASTGIPLVELLKQQDIIAGIKVDKGLKPIPGYEDESYTEGLDGLEDRLDEYRNIGAQFTKWRGVINIGQNIPSVNCIKINSHSLARYAALSQKAGLVPIVEPEVLMDGSHDISRCYQVTKDTLREVFYALGEQGVDLRGILLKPNMVLSGKDSVNRAGAKEVAYQTLNCFAETVPVAVPGIVFLSGGQGDEEATVNLNSINLRAKEFKAPWELSFSYGRGLQAAPLKAWNGKEENKISAQKVFYERSNIVSLARQGKY
jgi:fructose-bisphosphate aldolase class I